MRWVSKLLLLAAVVATNPAATVRAQRSGFELWPFGKASDDVRQEPNGQEESSRPWFLRSPLENVDWPQLSLPRVGLLPGLRNEREGRFLGQNQPSMWERMAAARQRLTERTRRAWNGTVERLKFGRGNGDPRYTRSAPRKPWFERMFGGEPEPEGPRTVSEWIAQDRLEP